MGIIIANILQCCKIIILFSIFAWNIYIQHSHAQLFLEKLGIGKEESAVSSNEKLYYTMMLPRILFDMQWKPPHILTSFRLLAVIRKYREQAQSIVDSCFSNAILVKCMDAI